MRAAVLAAVPHDHPSLAALATVLRQELLLAGYTEVAWFDLAATPLAYCQGEFDCWVATPGACKSRDAEQEIAAAVHEADAVVLLGPVTFGGHGYTQKRALDRLICLLSPYFEKRASLTHHARRYDRYAGFFSLGWLRLADAEQARTFEALADANALNFLAPAVGVAVVSDDARQDWPARVRSMLSSTASPGSALSSRWPLTEQLFEAALGEGTPAEGGTKAALLVGSAKPRGTSTSELLGRALGRRLEAKGWQVELHFATEFVHDNERALASALALASADLLLLASPLYVDAFPALLTHALELLARARRSRPEGLPRSPRLGALLNCGFPEAEHNRTALRIARHFAEQAGYRWAGGLALGGGGAVAGRSLDDARGPAAHVVRALDAAASSLASGLPVPDDAITDMARAPMPDALYRLVGDLGWRLQAYQHGLAQSALRARPLDESDRDR